RRSETLKKRSFVKRALLFSLALSACASPPKIYPHRPLVDQILYPYPGKAGLVHRACTARDEKTHACTDWQEDEYLLSNAETRRALLELKFVCTVGDKYYAPCEEENALCRWHSCRR